MTTASLALPAMLLLQLCECGLLTTLALLVAVTIHRRWSAALLHRKRRFNAKKEPAPHMVDVVFLHPDLGIGGAERLVVDAAVGLLRCQDVYRRLRVSMVTNFHDPKRAFSETTDGTFPVIVRGSWFPRHIRNRGLVLCATIRMCIAAIATCILNPRTDVFIVDQVPAVMPIIKALCPASRIIFYCHFPDQLCDPQRATKTQWSTLHRLYRQTFNAIEAWTMQSADKILCNSQFSRGVTVATFPHLASRIHPIDDVYYPPIHIDKITTRPSAAASASSSRSTNPFGNMNDEELIDVIQQHRCVVSINRYERKKGIRLALESFAELLRRVAHEGHPSLCEDDMRLIVAGGYDPRLDENVKHFEELRRLAATLGIDRHTVFLRSISDVTKFHLLSHARCIVYTPSGEHFGIVPVEAMAFGRVVLAVNDGGPVESIGLGDENGFLRPPESRAFSEVLHRIMLHDDLCERIGASARDRCAALFSLQSFSKRLVTCIVDQLKLPH